MSALYEITHEFRILFSEFDELNAHEFDTNTDGKPIDDDGNVIDNSQGIKEAMLEAWFDTLEGIEGEFEHKAENVACYIKNLKAESENLKTEERALKTRREQKDRQVKKLTAYLMECMEAVNLKKLDTTKAAVSIRNNAESVAIENECRYIEWAKENALNTLKFMPEIRKTEIKRMLQAGSQVPECHITHTRSLIIK